MITVSDLKQYAFCPRIPYYTLVCPVKPPPTELMERGNRLEAEFRKLEVRRGLRRYGWEGATRHFGVHAESPGLGLVGVIDLILERPDRVAIVDVKASAAYIGNNHRMQATAYQLLAAEHYGKPCDQAFIYFLDRAEIECLRLEAEWTHRLTEALRQMRQMIATHELPPPTPNRQACATCEFKNFCGDVF